MQNTHDLLVGTLSIGIPSIVHRGFSGCRTTFRLFRRVPPQLMPFDLLLLELKYSSVLSTQLYQLVV